ncbi:energy-coupling factor ABC transporter ATP-binding protein [Flexivirga sp. B27]
MAAERSHEPGEPPVDATRDTVFVGKGIGYSYLDKFPALDDVSFDVRRGEMLALLGANGCGKSTLLKVLDGLVFPTSGTLHAFGEQVTEDNLEDEGFAAGFRSRVGFVFQNSDAQVFSATVREEVAFGCLQLGMGQDETLGRVDDVLAMLDIRDLADRAPFQLSGGQKKRVAIASVLVMNPEVLLFDEPTAGLDPRTQSWLIDLLVQLHESGKTIVHATHDLHVLEQIATRCLVFSEEHRLLRSGTPRDILANQELLLATNLVHQHRHRHRTADGDITTHSHPHPVVGHHHDRP